MRAVLKNKINMVFDMETADPDDVFTLCILSHHPKVNLVGVTISPGSLHQVGLVKFILNKLNLSIPIGSKNKNHAKECVSQFHYNWLGKVEPTFPDETGEEVLLSLIRSFPDLEIVCGASLGNIAALLKNKIELQKLVIQGGFAGSNIVPENLVLDKFKNKITCPTFNLNGDVNAALSVLSAKNVAKRYNVSKNVCHGVVYDQNMHEWMRPYQNFNPGIKLMFDGMDFYLKNKSNGKAFHDPLAACVAIDDRICEFKHVELYREWGEWGSRYSNNLNTLISISVDMEKFKKTIVGLEINDS